MTGFGEAQGEVGPVPMAVTVRSVNARFFDFRFKSAPAFMALEPAVRGLVQGRLPRGKIDVSLFIDQRRHDACAGVYVRMEVAKAYCDALRQLQRDLDLAGDISLGLLVGLPNVVQTEPEVETDEAAAGVVLGLVEQAVTALIAMQEREGAVIAADLLARVARLKTHMQCIQDVAAGLPKAIQARLEQRLAALLGDVGIDPQRLAQEVALLADRADITEEMVRFRSHCGQFCQTVQGAEVACGKRLDFIVQELLRETNTIGSKAGALPIIDRVIGIKEELERIREQVQNVI
jgi:uncharacterized protein (TIGR00255 family)